MKKRYGFTLIELLIAISIMAILAALAIPSYLDLIEKGRLRGAAEAVYEQLQYARTQALKRSLPITIDFWIDPSDATKTTWSVGITDDAGCWDDDASTACTWGCDADPSVDPSTNPDTACVIEYDNDTSVDYGPGGVPDGVDDKILMLLASTGFTNIAMTGTNSANPLSFGIIPGPAACKNIISSTEACFEPIRGLSRKTIDPAGHIELTSGNYKLQVRVDDTGGVKICRPTSTKIFVGFNDCT